MDYNFPQKEHWRNRVWNELSARVAVHPRDAIVIYLAAEQDMDRETAIRKGFLSHNLIAVDRDEAAVAALREKGALAIHGDIFQVIDHWPAHTPIHAIIADFTCGMRMDVLDGIAQAQTLASAENAVWVVNLLCGRDAQSNEFRAELSKYRQLDRVPKWTHKHRALAAWGYAMGGPAHCCFPHAELTPQNVSDWTLLHRKCCDRSAVKFGRYRSTAHQTFDWAIWSTSFLDHGAHWLQHTPSAETKSVGRSISAILAHRTRRLAA